MPHPMKAESDPEDDQLKVVVVVVVVVVGAGAGNCSNRRPTSWSLGIALQVSATSPA